MSSFGRFYRITTFGESHSPQVGVIVEGFPSNIQVDQEFIQEQLTRRRPGQSALTTPRDEKDRVTIQSGIENNLSLGTPIAMTVNNENYIKVDYNHLNNIPRPGHADYTYQQKYGIRAESGGGRSSARETIGRVCAGALADLYLTKIKNINISAFVSSVGKIKIPKEELSQFMRLTKRQIDVDGDPINEEKQIIDLEQEFQIQNDKIIIINTRCPHPKTSVKIIQKIQEVKSQKDSIGGTVTCCISNVPVGLGEPCFDKLEALLAHAMLSIPATKGFEIGSGFQGCKMQGSGHNDMFYCKENADQSHLENKDNNFPLLQCKSNNHGGTLGGISSGEDIYFKVAFKPVSTIGKEQHTCDMNGSQTILEAKGRHDPCVLPRAPPIVESMASIVIMDMYQAQKLQIKQ